MIISTQELRQDERTRLLPSVGWVEIDADAELEDMEGAPLGIGGFGTVRMARWRESVVAVKYLTSASGSRDLIRSLRKEITVHQRLRYDFVVNLYGASTVKPHLCLVMELSRKGSLQDLLRSSEKPLAHALQVAFLYDIARGMLFLHKSGILHRDLKSANVLVFDNHRLKLCDFGMAKVKGSSTTTVSSSGAGTVQWTSPEEFEGGSGTELTDVYRLAISSMWHVIRNRSIRVPCGVFWRITRSK